MEQLTITFPSKPIFLPLETAKDLIHKSTSTNIESVYKECWRSVATDNRVKLEKWWVKNKDCFAQFKADTNWMQGEKQQSKEVYELVLTDEERRMCEEEIALWESDLLLQEIAINEAENLNKHI